MTSTEVGLAVYYKWRLHLPDSVMSDVLWPDGAVFVLQSGANDLFGCMNLLLSCS